VLNRRGRGRGRCCLLGKPVRASLLVQLPLPAPVPVAAAAAAAACLVSHLGADRETTC